MAYEIHIGRLADDLETVIPITKQEWLDGINHLEDLIYVEEAFPDSIQTYSVQSQDWIPVFWISNGKGFMRASGFFSDPVSYEKAIEIAQYLNAYIYGDENEIYYLPGYGVVYDDAELENPELRLDDLLKYKSEYGNDYQEIIKAVEREKQVERRQVTIAASKTKKTDKVNGWTIVTIVLVILSILYLIVN